MMKSSAPSPHRPDPSGEDTLVYSRAIAGRSCEPGKLILLPPYSTDTAYDHLTGEYCHGFTDRRHDHPRFRKPGWLKAIVLHERSPIYVIRQWIRWQRFQTRSLR